jgi:cell division protein ZapE
MGEQFQQLTAGQASSSASLQLEHRSIAVVRHSAKVLWCRFADLCLQPLAATDYIALCDRFQMLLLSDVPQLGSPTRPSRIARGTEDGVERVAAGDRALPALSVHDDAVRRFIALVDECYDRRVPLYLEANVDLTALYTEGALTFAFRRTLSRLQEMQLERFASALPA